MGLACAVLCGGCEDGPRRVDWLFRFEDGALRDRATVIVATITRGTKEKALRAVYEVPAGRGFVVGDITIDGRKIEFGAQIADFIRIKLTGLATRLGQSTVAPFNGCVESATQDDPAAGPAAPPKVAAVLTGMDFPVGR